MATSQQEVDWQSTKKTVLERSRHMFNNPFMSDIAFNICEGSEKKFFAHKYVLATSSAVFYAMFYGKLAEKNSVVHLSDTDEESLEEFLRFLYTDECNLTTHNAMFVLYLAKKYIVPSLAQKCVEFLEANIAVENVSTILQQALQFNEKKLENKCLELIDLKTSKTVACDAFIDIKEATLAHILKRESLTVREVDLFKAVLKWSEAECSRKGIEANAKNKRAAMGNAIYQIRFASMTLQDFAQNVSQSGILTPEEMVLFYEKFSGVERTSEVWNMSETRAKEDILLRCCRFDSYGESFVSSTVSTLEDALGISFSKPVKIHGVHLLGWKRQEYNVKLEVWSWIIEKKFHSKQDNRRVSGFDVMLPVPIKVRANVPVHLTAIITGRCWTYVNAPRVRKTVETNGITVSFETKKDSVHFNEIIFSEM
ncbi:BTB POZ domain-containing 6-like [Paramuricea clavata]|uniref:BTB POZ domain-containing 6-like n=1 Tax=Paramuricea clavata TaxID=317549 RepID=A0A7D9DTA5_PARCT|nr:BTB POZ domain-containing 6-like [Paramuricea clavata]